jgi:hypothetical protein
VPGIDWGDALYNWVFAFLGNLVGAAVFVSTAYWFLYLRDAPVDAEVEPNGSSARFERGGAVTAER